MPLAKPVADHQSQATVETARSLAADTQWLVPKPAGRFSRPLDVLLYDVISRGGQSKTAGGAATRGIIGPITSRPRLENLADDRGQYGILAWHTGPRVDQRSRHGQRRQSGAATATTHPR